MKRLLYLLFFFSGASGLIYEVVWVREFGNVFGNTVHSASLVIAVFMCGLGVGSYLVGRWADGRRSGDPGALLRAYGYFELAIGVLGLAVSLLLPLLGPFAASLSSYTREATGWYAPSFASHLARYAIAVVLLTPITILMGGTLTLLIRHLLTGRLEAAGWAVAMLYGVNTAGAAAGAFLTDYFFIPAVGLLATQMAAVSLNLLAAAGALRLASRAQAAPREGEAATAHRPGAAAGRTARSAAVRLAGLALFLSGLAAMGMEILWFRHMSLLLSGLRSVFSLLLTVVLAGMWLGSVAGGFLHRRFGNPVRLFTAAQALFSLSALLGLAMADVGAIRALEASAAGTPDGGAGWIHAADLWFNARPILIEVAVPALLMGFAFPLGNAVVQRAESAIGRRAGALYLANTLGAVAGALGAGLLLLPALGMQGSAAVLAATATLAAAALWAAGREFEAPGVERRLSAATLGLALGLTGVSVAAWMSLPRDYLISRAQQLPPGRGQVLAMREGLTEVVAVAETPDHARLLITNGHPMSSTHLFNQRYMRAFAHIPLLAMEAPKRVLVIGFGVGSTAHAASLHPTVERVEVADLSRNVLEHSGYFAAANGRVLEHPKVSVYVNDGRDHLRLQAPGTYDLITLEPPPLAFAGVSALYSRDFYRLARTRLAPGGYLTQWLPAHQVPAATTLSMTRAFVDVFPESVLLSGWGSELILMGVNDSRIRIDPARVGARLARAPAVQEDLTRLSLGTLREIVGTFVASGEALAAASQRSAPVADDHPLQEYAVRSRLPRSVGLPRAIFAVAGVAAWCPDCFAGGRPVPLVDGLDTYLAILDAAYLDRVSPDGRADFDARAQQLIDGSPYLSGLLRWARPR